MTNQDAIKTLYELCRKANGSWHQQEVYRMAIFALEKQIPKKPHCKEKDSFLKNQFVVYSYCPECEKQVIAGDMFCVMCDQTIDWTEDEWWMTKKK